MILPMRTKQGEFGAIENVVVVGYPIGLWDSTNNLPIVRSGITATHPAVDFLGRQEFLVDAACFVGSSGSPVFLYNPHGWLSRSGVRHLDQSQVRLLGIVYAVARHTEKGEIRMEKAPTKINLVAETEVPTNTAYVIKASRLLEFDAVFREMEAKIAASRWSALSDSGNDWLAVRAKNEEQIRDGDQTRRSYVGRGGDDYQRMRF